MDSVYTHPSVFVSNAVTSASMCAHNLRLKLALNPDPCKGPAPRPPVPPTLRKWDSQPIFKLTLVENSPRSFPVDPTDPEVHRVSPVLSSIVLRRQLALLGFLVLYSRRHRTLLLFVRGPLQGLFAPLPQSHCGFASPLTVLWCPPGSFAHTDSAPPFTVSPHHLPAC